MAELEDIRHGMASAVDEQMKSERMKVELIANVSHDIKTPLTSIISYVQFLKEEKELPEHVQDYVKILDEKSQRPFRISRMRPDSNSKSLAVSIFFTPILYCKIRNPTRIRKNRMPRPQTAPPFLTPLTKPVTPPASISTPKRAAAMKAAAFLRAVFTGRG